MTKKCTFTSGSARPQSFVLLVVFFTILATVYRDPRYFKVPRIWAEEGSVYIQSVLDNGILTSLFLPQLGYYSLFNNLAAAASYTIFGLEKIAFGTTLISMIVLFACIWTPLVLESRFWRQPYQRYCIIAAALFFSPGEIWLNTINIQFYLCLFTVFLLLSDLAVVDGWRKSYIYCLAILASTTGITSVILLPFFILKMYQNRKTCAVDCIIVIILSLGLVIQLTGFAYSFASTNINRLSVDHLSNWLNGVYVTSSVVLFGIPDKVKILVVATFIFLLIVKAKAIQKNQLLPIVFFYLILAFTTLSLGMSGGLRYGYAPALVAWIFLINLQTKENILLEQALFFIIVAVMFFKITIYSDMSPYYDSSWASFSINNIQVDENGVQYLPIFPQWPETSWRIIVPNTRY
jgi:hypothetical protein